MDNAQRVRQLHSPNDHGAASGEVVRRAGAVAVPRAAGTASTPPAVSRSSYLNERDRHYRAAETVENAGDLAERTINGVLRLDARLREAEAEGASPRALANIERVQEVFGQGSGMLVFDYLQKPYERW